MLGRLTYTMGVFSPCLRRVRRSPCSFRGIREGMEVYAVAEMSAPPPLRRFVFANSEDEDASAVELLAREFRGIDDMAFFAYGWHSWRICATTRRSRICRQHGVERR
jgi:hypothetical protein